MLTGPPTTLELFSNELFFDLFDYLNDVDLLCAFAALNTRLDSLLFHSSRTSRVDLRSIYREDFDFFFAKHIPSIKSHLMYLRLSDDDETPDQCVRFLSTGLTLGQFSDLRSLTLNNVTSDPRINEDFFADLHRLRHLTHLKFVDCPFSHLKENDFQGVIDQIWNLPRLTHFYWNCQLHQTHWFALPACVSTSLQVVSIYQENCSSHSFAPVLVKTPKLRKFAASLGTYEEDDLPAFEAFLPAPPHLSVRKLVFSEVSSQRLLNNLLPFFPNVTHLKIETKYSIKFDGHQWEEIIVKYLPQLQVFQLRMIFAFRWTNVDEENHQEKFNRYFETYRNSFWFEHHWFFRCHLGLFHESVSIYLYSLPHVFDDYRISCNTPTFQTQSTCPDDLTFSYQSVRHIGYEPWMFNDPAMSQVQLLNIETLSVALPLDSQFLSTIPTFSNLRSLSLDILPLNSESRIQRILDCSPRLQTLAFSSWITLAMPPYRLDSPSIHRLDLEGLDQVHRQCSYNSQQCVELSRSPLGRHCRVLTIAVEESQCILFLALMMLNLRTLHVRFEGDDRRNEHDLVQILRESLPTRWNVTRECYGSIVLQSWFLCFCQLKDWPHVNRDARISLGQ